MDPLFILLRLIHIIGGMLWVGIGVFVPVFLAPTLEELGPDAGKVMGGLQKHGFMVALPMIALLTIISGIWLYLRMSGGQVGVFFGTRVGMAFGVGGLAAIVAFTIGILFTRPTMMRVAKLMQGVASAAPADRPELLRTATALRDRGTMLTRVVGVLLVIAAAMMAVARFA